MSTVEEIQRSSEESVAPDPSRPAARDKAVRVPGLRDGRDLVLENALKAIDPAVARSFTDEQRRALRTLLGLRSSARHIVDIRQRICFAGRRYYFAFLFGRERRQFGNESWLQKHSLTLASAGLLLVLLFGLAALLR